MAEYKSYDLYQLTDGPMSRYRFCSYAVAQAFIKAEDYTHVYSGLLNVVAEPDVILEDLYRKHNMEQPMGRKTRSMSVSDIVVLHMGDKASAWYVNNIGFKKLNWEG